MKESATLAILFGYLIIESSHTSLFPKLRLVRGDSPKILRTASLDWNVEKSYDEVTGEYFATQYVSCKTLSRMASSSIVQGGDRDGYPEAF